MKCDICGSPAAVHVCEMCFGKKTERHLCSRHAGAAEGVGAENLPPDRRTVWLVAGLLDKIVVMSTVSEIERAIEQLAPDDFVRIREWIAKLDASRWDKQLENDVAAGRLDELAAEALDDLKNGRCTDL